MFLYEDPNETASGGNNMALDAIITSSSDGYGGGGPNYDDNLDYRDLKITKQWIKKDPIIYFEKKYKNYLQEFNEIKKKTDFEINKIFNKTVKESYPDKVSLFRNLYAD